MTAFDPSTNPTQLSGYNDVQFSAWVLDQILDEERPYNVMVRDFFWATGNHPSAVAQFPKQDDPGAASDFGIEGNSGSLGANTALTTGNAQATLDTMGQMATVTKELQYASVIDVVAQVKGVLGRSCAEKFETDATSLLDEYANTSGTAGVATSYATLLSAKNKLIQRDQVGQCVFVLDPIQTGNVQQDLGTSGAAALARGDIRVGEALASDLTGYFAELAGSPIFHTSLVSATGGAVFVRGVAMGLYEAWDTTVEMFHDITVPGDVVAATKRYGVIEIRDRAGETILI